MTLLIQRFKLFPLKEVFKLVLPLFFLCTNTVQGQEHARFIHVNPFVNNVGLYINRTLQDDSGFIVMSHANGIVTYDGYEYFNRDISSIYSSLELNEAIVEIKKDARNNIWILSNKGKVAVMNADDNSKIETPFAEIVVQFLEVSESNVYLGTSSGEIYSYDYKRNTIVKITKLPGGMSVEIKGIVDSDNEFLFISTDQGKLYQYSFETTNISSLKGGFSDYPSHLYITLDRKGKIWIGSETFGLFVYDIKTERFIQDALFKPPYHNIKKEMFISVFCDSKGNIWGGTDGGGLYCIDSITGVIRIFTHHPTNKHGLNSNTIININEDSHNNIWILTNDGKVNVLPYNNSEIQYHEGTDDNTPVKLLSILKSRKGSLWLGTDGEGITKVDTLPDGTTTEKQFFDTNFLKKGYYVQSIVEDDASNIWFGTYKNGLWCYNYGNSKMEKIEIINEKKQQVSDVRTVFVDSKKRIWVGSNLSLNIFNSSKKLIASFANNSNGLKGSIAESIIEDDNGNIWIGYFKGGLFKLDENTFDVKKSTFISYPYFDQKKYKNDILGVRFMSKDNDGLLWLINSYGMLLSYNPISNKYVSYDELVNFDAQSINSILIENQQNLWLGTSKGIIHFDSKMMTQTKYTEVDGLHDNYFISRSAFKDDEGTFYFGGLKGVSIFNPENMHKTVLNPKLYVTAIEVLNQQITDIIPEQVTKSINYIENLKLSADQSSFSFRFSAIDNPLFTNYNYAYRLVGFNDKWIVAEREQLATYTNIPSGDYVFEVRAGIKEGVWNINSTPINITIAPPLWRHPVAYFAYGLLLLVLVFLLKKWFALKDKIKEEVLLHKKDEELHDAKMVFFSKLSHEIQTPLTLISNPLQGMIQNAELEGNRLLAQRLNIIGNNVKRLSRIVFELTSVRNKEIGRQRLYVTENNLFTEIQKIALSFNEQARYKKIDFTVNCSKNLSSMWYDQEKFEHIIYNLLSNAFKFTPKEGRIQLNVLAINENKAIEITISDSGPGISEEDMSHIFTLFYQSSEGKNSKGSGIGLALTKELVDLLKGEISVHSTVSEGTTFKIILPIIKEVFTKEEIVQNITIEDCVAFQDEIDEGDETKEVVVDTTNTQKEKTILIVEDNFELQLYLEELLSPMYHVIIADDGEEGVRYAKEFFPDLILSDVMMPKKSGIEMCKELQGDVLTKHIPVMLLTANNSTNSKIAGLESGAMEYINKPFNANELVLKVNNFIKATESIISDFKKDVLQIPDVDPGKTKEDTFLENLIEAINFNLENPHFKMEELKDILNLSYSSIYRKCMTLTGESLVNLMRILRLKKSAIVIATYGYNIAEAAYISGFNDPKYFSKCFKNKFGISPVAFKREAQEIGLEECLTKYKLNASMDVRLDIED